MWRMAAAIVLLSEVMLSGHPQPPPRDSSTATQSGTATIRGRVVAADSREPLRSARVLLSGATSVPPVFTGDDGRFVFANLPSGRYTIFARKAGYAATSFGKRRPDLPPIPIDLGPGSVFQNAELQMARSAAISGRITDEFGDPLEPATVTALRIVRRGGVVVSMVGATAVTDDLGEYYLGGLPAGTYIVAASPPKRGPEQTRAYYPGVAARVQAQPITLQAGERRSATDFTAAPGQLAKLTITFTDLKGEPANAVAMIANVGPWLGDAGAPIVPMVGSVVTRAVEPGDWSIFARSPEVGVGFARVSIGSDDTAITMRLAKGGRVTGRLVSERGSIPSDAAFVVEAFQAAPSPGVTLPPSGGFSRASGPSTFELTELLGPRQFRARPAGPSRWFLTDIVYDGRSLLDKTIDFKGGETLDGVQVVVSDRGGTLKGSAADAQGTPVSDYFALIFPEDASSLARLQRLANAGRSNHNGEFAIENLPPGSYLAVAVDDVDDVIPPTIENLRRFRPSVTRFTIEPGRTTTVTLTFVP